MKTTYNFFDTKDKHFFAGLFNTAVNNFDLSLNELKKRINSKQNNSKGIIDDAFDDKKTSHIDFDNNFKYLSESFSFLNRIPSFLKNKNKKDKTKIELRDFLKGFLRNLYDTLSTYRNYYTHYYHEDIEINADVIDFINYVLFNSASRVKEERVKTDEMKSRLSSEKYYKKDFESIVATYNTKIEEINDTIAEENKGKADKDKQKFKKKVTDHKANFVTNKMFQFFINEKGETKLNEYIKSEKEDKKLTRGGLIQFLAFFTSKRQINVLFDNINYTYDLEDTDLQKLIARWVYTFESYRNIKKLFKSDYDNDSLLLQMVSELSKCPNDLYPYLNQGKKNEFLEDINIYLKESEYIFDSDLVSHEVLRKRYQDKFPYFAIRFLDEFGGFPNLRFQINMGKFNHNTMEKKHSSGVKTERSILEKLVVFENLSKVTDAKKRYFEKIEETKDVDWVKYPRPHYQFFGNNIGIWLKDKHFGNYVTEKERNEGKLTKYDILKKLKLQNALKKPVAFLSFNELPALLYNLLIKGDSPTEIEQQIINKINASKKFIASLSKDTKYNSKHPYKLKKILKIEGDYDWDKIAKHINCEIEENPLATIRKFYTKQPKDETILSLSEKGKIATWLSKDIKRYVAKDKKKEWRGYQFAEFQSLLSYYDIDSGRVANFMTEDLKIDLQYSLPFDGFDFEKENLYAFYLNYLSKRKEYLYSLIEAMNIGDYSLDFLRPYDKKNFMLRSIDKYKEGFYNHPIMLSRGIFDDKPTAKNRDVKKEVSFANWFEASRHQDKAQEFYNYTKYYPINDVLKNTINPKKPIKQQYLPQTEKKLQKEIYKNETKIRKTMRNDFYVLQMIKHVFKKANEVDNEVFDKLTLKDFYLTKQEKENYEKKAALQSEKEAGDKTAVIYNESYILKSRVPISLLGGKIKGNTALKDSSKYKSLSQDTKVRQLTEYFDDKEWTIDEISNEISHYELVRSKKFFSLVYQLEKKIYLKAENNNNLEQLKQGKYHNFAKYLTYYYLDNLDEKEAFGKIDKDESIEKVEDKYKKLFILRQIRNKFAHNQLLPTLSFKYLQENYKMEANEKVGSFLNRIFSIIVAELKD